MGLERHDRLIISLSSCEIKAPSWLDRLEGGARTIFRIQFHSALVVCNTAMVNRVFLSFSVFQIYDLSGRF